MCLLSAVVLAQSPAYEVASIKPNISGNTGSSVNSNRGEVRMTNVTLKQLIQQAYDVKDYSTVAPPWLDGERFDIVAKAPAALPQPAEPMERRRQSMVMLQALLADRFKLQVHRETKMLSGYALVVAKGGLKIKEVPNEGNSGMNTNNGLLAATGASMQRLADWLARKVDRPVADKTSVTGVFNFKLEFSPEQALEARSPSDPPRATDSGASAPTIYSALQEQLGLKLQAVKVPVEMVVVDHVERTPTEN
jgi:uncharacterized protein (TIGR03435 family)